jgi:hypothetical protein
MPGMDPWKRIRLWCCIAVIVAFLGAGAWARFWWGVPDYPYGARPALIPRGLISLQRPWRSRRPAPPRTPNPFEELEDMYERYDIYGPRSKIDWLGRSSPMEWISVTDDF